MSSNKKEVLDAIMQAMEIEKETFDFYTTAEQKTFNPGGKRIFKWRARSEEQHYLKLSELYTSIDESGRWVFYGGSTISLEPGADFIYLSTRDLQGFLLFPFTRLPAPDGHVCPETEQSRLFRNPAQGCKAASRVKADRIDRCHAGNYRVDAVDQIQKLFHARLSFADQSPMQCRDHAGLRVGPLLIHGLECLVMCPGSYGEAVQKPFEPLVLVRISGVCSGRVSHRYLS